MYFYDFSMRKVFTLVLFFVLLLGVRDVLARGPGAFGLSGERLRDVAGQSYKVSEERGAGKAGLSLMIAKGIQFVLYFLGIVFIIIVIVGGFRYVTAGGNQDQVKTARKWIFNGMIGILIVLSAFAITSFAIRGMQQAVVQYEYED